MRNATGAIFCILMVGVAVSAQAATRIDFQRDVQPIFRANCIGCHGPSMQKNNFRLDRRRDAMRGGTIAVIGPGNSSGSRLYLRLIGSQFGLQMPPTGPLDQKKIDLIKAWIDQGAEWPDALAGETSPAPIDPKAAKLMESLRVNDLKGFLQNLHSLGPSVNGKGPGGATPLMYAAIYGDAESIRELLKAGADPNLKNNAGATALMWAANDFDKTKLLVDAGADVNAKSDDGQTSLLIAAGYFGAAATVKLLLDHGADPSFKVTNATGDMTPLTAASYAGDANVIQLLLEHGADVKKAGYFPMMFSAFALCDRCIDLLQKRTEPMDLTMAMFFNVPPFADPRGARLLFDRVPDIKIADPDGHNILMMTASSATVPADAVKTLLARGIDVNARSAKGETALALARRHGQTVVVDLLMKAGAKDSEQPTNALTKPSPAGSIKEAINRSIPLLQRTDVSFLQKSGCVSCHNNTLTAMTVATARQKGFSVNEQIARTQLKAVSTYIDDWTERAQQNVGIPGDSDSMSYILLGLAAENHPSDLATDALARFLKNKQTPDGRWLIFAHRPPIESSDFQVTATCLRALQFYAPKRERSEYEKSIQLAAHWLANATPANTEDRAFRLMGLAWASGSSATSRAGKVNAALISRAGRDLLATQRPDGGWAQLPSLDSDAYATGQALVALNQVHVLSTSDAAYKRAIQFLLRTQMADGSWYVKSRVLPIQPFFESGFPHGHDQFISAAATNWATTALAQAAQP